MGRKSKSAAEQTGTNIAGQLFDLEAKIASSQRSLVQFAKLQDIPEVKDEIIGIYKQLGELLFDKCRMLEGIMWEQSDLIGTLRDSLKEEKLNGRRKLQQLLKAYKIKPTGKLADGEEENSEKSNGKTSRSSDPADKKKKKRGAPVGHRGASRETPKEFHKEKHIPPPRQCDCGCHNILPLDEHDHKFLEDIPPVVLFVTRLNYQRGECRDCGKVLRHPEAVSGPPTQIGPNLAAHLTMLNQMGVTFRKLSGFTTATLGVPLTPAGAYYVVDRAARHIRWVYEMIGDALSEQDVLGIDETGWKVNGVPWYIWIFCNSDLIYYHAVRSRAAKVLENVLGKNFKGIAICDFYAAYNILEKTQRCLVHLLRDIREEREILKDSVLLKRFEDRVKDFINKGLDIQKMPDGPEKDKALKKLQRQLDAIARMKVTKGKATTLIKRIAKYKKDIIRFASNPDVEYHNNGSERKFKNIIQTRKNSFGSDTAQGAFRTCVTHSVIGPLKQLKIKAVDFIKKVMEDPAFRVFSIEELKARNL